MADEEVQEITDEAEGGGGKSGGNPWIPIVVVVILFPVISFALTEFVLIPRIRAAVNPTGIAMEAAVQGEQDAKAEGGEEQVGAELQQFVFDDVVANVHGTMQTRYVKVSFTVEGKGETFIADMEKNQVKMVDITIGILNGLSLKDLEKAGIKNLVRSDLINAFNTALKGKVIEAIYFSDFVVQ